MRLLLQNVKGLTFLGHINGSSSVQYNTHVKTCITAHVLYMTTRRLLFYASILLYPVGWLSSRVVSVPDSGAEGPEFKSPPRRCRCLRQTVHTHRASVHQAAKVVAALLRVAGVTAGLTESNGSLSLSS